MNDDGVTSGARTSRRRIPIFATRVAVMAACLLLHIPASSQERLGDSEHRGRELARRVMKTQDKSGFRIRARVIIGPESDDAPPPTVLQVRILGRREKNETQILYQVLWPTRLKGHAAVIERHPLAPVTGFLFEPPDHATKLTPALMATPFAGTVLNIEDLAEDFWGWPLQQVAGREGSGKEPCTILLSRPSPEMRSAYSLVRSCINSQKATPVWIEKFGHDNQRIKRISFESSSRKTPAQDYRLAMMAESADAAMRTRVEILKSERGISVSPDEFSIERLNHLGSKSP